MKKFLLSLGVVAMVMSISSCSKNSGNFTPEEKALGDSVATALGRFAGAQEATKYERMKLQMDSAIFAKYGKEAFLRGLKDALKADTTQLSYIQGFQFGTQLLSPMMGIRQEANVPVDGDKIYEAFKAAYLSDSAPDMQAVYMDYQNIINRVQEVAQNRMLEAKRNSPEAKENAEKGQAYAEKMLASNAGYQKTSDGLVYLITNPGEGEKVQPNSQVKVKYVGKHVDGTEFDKSGDEPATLYANHVVPGFSEGLQMLGTGGTAVLVIPADLGYGVDGSGSVIGPNETLVFDIEVVEIVPAAE